MNNTVEHDFFGFPKVKWLHLTGLLDLQAWRQRWCRQALAAHLATSDRWGGQICKISCEIFSGFNTHTHTHIRLTALCPGLPRWASTRKVKQIWILLEQEKVSGSGTHWAICKSASRTRQATTPAPHCSVFYRPDALPPHNQQCQSKHTKIIKIS